MLWDFWGNTQNELSCCHTQQSCEMLPCSDHSHGLSHTGRKKDQLCLHIIKKLICISQHLKKTFYFQKLIYYWPVFLHSCFEQKPRMYWICRDKHSFWYLLCHLHYSSVGFNNLSTDVTFVIWSPHFIDDCRLR